MEIRCRATIGRPARVAFLFCFVAAFYAHGQQETAAAADDAGAATPAPINPVPPSTTPIANPTAPFRSTTVRSKLARGAKETLDWTLPLIAASSAGIDQLADYNPSLGQGGAGFGKRFYRYYADEAMKQFLVKGVMSSVFNQDTYYSRRGRGTFWGRFGYATSRVLVARSDSGKPQFNYAEVAGVSATVAISTSYFPDQRDASDTFQRISFDLAGDALSNVLKEFWPDLKRKFAR
jgi:hypothetical protein